MGMENIIDMIDVEVYKKYLPLMSKDYTMIPVKNKSALDYWSIDGAGHWGTELYHYCTIDTLKSITKEKRLRFSDIRFLNDTTEFIEAIRLLKKRIEDQKSSMNQELYNILSDEKTLDELKNYFQRYPFYPPIDNSIKMDSVNPVCKIYTCSFSLHGDLLPMWNYYAHGAGGVSINFADLKDHMKPDNVVKLSWGGVWYEEEDKRQCIDELLKDIRELYPQIPNDKVRKTVILNVLFSAMNKMRVFMKNENYSTEKEYRAVLIVPDTIIRDDKLPEGYEAGYFNKGNIIIPYIDVPFAPESLKKIIVGSGAVGEFSLIKLGLEDWLIRQSLNNVGIYQSNIPMRKY